MAGAFSLAVLESALRAGANLCGVLLSAAPRTGLPVLAPYAHRTILDVARERGVAARAAVKLTDEDTLAFVRQAQPEVIAVACWPRLVPSAFRGLASLAVNVHPSLLPDNRGPAPVYWTLRLGYPTTGVTVHVLTDRADAGPILAQREVPVPAGISAEELELQLAELGGQLLAHAHEGEPQPQDESRATYHGWPA
jgi:methionyl-tRNA formyltransferase